MQDLEALEISGLWIKSSGGSRCDPDLQNVDVPPHHQSLTLWVLQQPCVVPLRDGAAAKSLAGEHDESMLAFSPQLLQAQAEGRGGRFSSAADFHALYKSGDATPAQVVETLLPLVQRGQDPPSKYELAWLSSNVEEIRAAAKASTERWAAGKPLGVLDGVPIGVKCDLNMKGYISTIGMKVQPGHPFFKPAETTVWPVEKLQQAGAIVMGHNNMHEIGMGKTTHRDVWSELQLTDGRHYWMQCKVAGLFEFVTVR